jgi:hypothetical protein
VASETAPISMPISGGLSVPFITGNIAATFVLILANWMPQIFHISILICICWFNFSMQILFIFGGTGD